MPTRAAKINGHTVATKTSSSSRAVLRLVESDVTKTESNRFGKLDQRHWKSRLLVRTYRRDAEAIQDANYYVRIQYKGHRHLFDTGEADKSAACRAAAAIYKAILSKGWDKAINDNAETLGKARKIPKVELSGTVGALIQTFEAISTSQESSRLSYYRAIRKIYADIYADMLIMRTSFAQ